MPTKPPAKTPLSRLERETIIVFNEAEALATLTTNSPGVARRLTKRLGDPLGNLRGPETWEWEVPKAWVLLPRSRKSVKSSGNSRSLAAARAALAKKKAQPWPSSPA